MSESEERESVSIVGICGGKGENKKKEQRPSVRQFVCHSYFLHEPQRAQNHNSPSSSHEIHRQYHHEARVASKELQQVGKSANTKKTANQRVAGEVEE